MSDLRLNASAGFFREIAFAGRFGLVGLAATAVHVAVLWLLLESQLIHILAANVLAFLVAFGVSFLGHYHFTFSAPGNQGEALKRFFLIACVACFSNTVVLAALIRLEWLSDFQAGIVAIAAIPLFTFIAARLWGFRRS